MSLSSILAMSVLGGITSLNPTIPMPELVWSVGALLGVYAGFWTNTKARQRLDRDELKNGFIIPSDESKELSIDQGLRLGYTTDFNQPVDIPNSHFQRHMAILGTTGMGKTVMINNLIWQQLVRGGGFIFIDAKLDYDTLRTMVLYHRLLGIEGQTSSAEFE